MNKIIFLIDKHKEKCFAILLVFFCYSIFYPLIDNDTYWILNIGRYITQNGLFNIDPFTIHQGLNVTVQQWLSDVIFYGVYNCFGKTGIFIMMFVLFLSSSLVLYRICVNQGNKTAAKIITLISCIFINLLIKARPQIFSHLIFLVEILLLEKYILKPKKSYLFILVLLSVLLINLHAAIWPVFFVLFIPYILDGFKFKKLTSGYGTLPFIITFITSFVAGLLNPYGTQNMFYFLKSYGIKSINLNIVEMFSPDFKSPLGIFIFILILVCIFVIKNNRRNFLRHILLTLGTLYMGLSSLRSLFLFFISLSLLTANYFKEHGILNAVFKDARKKVIAYIAIFIVIISAALIKQFRPLKMQSEFEPQGAVSYIKQNIDESSMRLFNDFESGGYIEYSGLKAFIDSRCEIFVKKFNQKEDVFIDYINYLNGKLTYNELAEKYNITHFLVKIDAPITQYLLNDANYSTIYRDEKYVLIEVKKQTTS